MQIFHTGVKKSKKRKPTAKQRQAAAEWEQLLKKYATKTPTVKKHKELSDVYSLGVPACRETPKHPSLPPSMWEPCTKKAAPVYTGTAMKGIGTMHKSNAIPIFSDEHAVEISRMRRG